MTTVIAHKGVLTADRRKVTNSVTHGMTGLRDETKITIAPFGIYAMIGFEPMEHSKKYNSQDVESMLDIFATLEYFAHTSFLDTPLAKTASTEDLRDFSDIADGIRKVYANYLAKYLDNMGGGLMLLTKHRAHMVRYDRMTSNSHSLVLAGGSAGKMAAILKDHGCDYADIYRALRLSGAPTGQAFESVAYADHVKDLFPPIGHAKYLAKLGVEVIVALRDSLRNNKEKSAEELADLKTQFIDEAKCFIASLYSFGVIKENWMMHFSKNPQFSFMSPESRKDNPAWSAADKVVTNFAEKFWK